MCQCEISRRSLLLAAAAVLPPKCCETPELPPAALATSGNSLTVNLQLAPLLCKPGSSAKFTANQLDFLLSHPKKDVYVVSSRKCTHGGAPLVYNELHQSIQCTSLNHTEYDLQGKILRGPPSVKTGLKTFPVARRGHVLTVSL
jgi:nitrite reductase/ring-hydroxylating ferredoxin subunit